MSARDLPEDIARAAALIDSLFDEFFTPPPSLTNTAWAESHRVLSAKDSSEPGPYRITRTPYALEPQDALSPASRIEEVVLMWGAQTSKTTIGGNWIGASIDMMPGPIMIVQPTLDLAKRYSRQRLVPLIDESERLRSKIADNRSRDDSNTILLKEYPGGFIAITGANSAAGLRSIPIRDIFFDEIDAYPFDVDGEGDPIDLAQARQSTFPRRKRLKTSTPTIKGASRIESAFHATDRRYYHIACPHCGELQRLEWGAKTAYGIKWRKDAAGNPLPDTVHYVCKHNGCIIEEHHKSEFLRCQQLGGQARWIPENPDANPRRRGYHLSSLYSPLGFLSWRELVEEWIAAIAAQRTGDSEKLKTFTNTRLAETWEEQGQGADSKSLGARAEDYELGIVPRAGLMLTMGVDTQPDRLEARVWAFGRGEESWLVGRHILYGDPNLDEGTEGSPWTRLTEIRRTPVLNAVGAQMLIEATCVDSGGHNTHAVYAYCRAHSHANVLAVKGASQYGRPVIGRPSAIDINWRGKTIARGVKVWQIGTDTAKHLLHGRMRIGQVGPGYVHVPKALASTDEFEQMTAARLMPATVNGKAVMRWITPAGQREEGGDCMVYAYAAACWLGIQTYREPGWARREAKYCPREPGLFDAPDATAAAPAPMPTLTTAPPRPTPAATVSPSPFASEDWTSRL